jgi:hypothetical protein
VDEPGVSLSISFHHAFPYTYITWPMNNRPIGGRSSETWFYAVDMIIIAINHNVVYVTVRTIPLFKLRGEARKIFKF